jgi:hypothetical protein
MTGDPDGGIVRGDQPGTGARVELRNGALAAALFMDGRPGIDECRLRL